MEQDQDYDPIVQIIDRPIDVTPELLDNLRAYLEEPKYEYADSILSEDEKKLLRHLANALTKRLIETLEANPTKRWAMRQLQETLKYVQGTDSEVRDAYGQVAVFRINKILGIRTTNGLVAFYL